MATVIKLKRGSGVPAALEEGEVAVDTANRRLYIGPTGGGAGQEMLDPVLHGVRLSHTIQAVSTNSAALAINLADGWYITLGLGHTITAFSFSNIPAAGRLCRVTLDITTTASANIAAWPSGVKWPGGQAPIITSGTGQRDTIVLTTTDGGAIWRGYAAGQDLR